MIPAIVTPINPTTGTPVVGISSGALSGNAPQVPAAISALAPGTLIKGFVLTRDGTGNPTLRSELGDFLIQSNFFLRIGSDVTVRVEAWGRNFRANIIEVDGKPVTLDSNDAQSQPQLQKSDQDQIIRSQWIPEVTQKNMNGRNELQAVLLNPTGATAQSQGLKEGTALIIKLFNIQLPTVVTNPSQQPSGQNTGTLSTPSHPTATGGALPSTIQNASSTIPNPNISTLPTPPKQHISQAYESTRQLSTVDTSVPDTELLPNISPNTLVPKQAMMLTVIGQEKDGEAVLQSPFGLIKITSNATLPTGTQLLATLTLSNTSSDDNPISLEGKDTTISLAGLAQKWTSLTQILQILTKQNDGLLPANIAASLPAIQITSQHLHINSMQAGAGLFLFMAALGGDFKSFIGEKNAKLLESLGYTHLLNKAEAEFGMLARLASDYPQQGWNSMFMPVMVNNQVEMVRWFTKREQEKDKDERRVKDGLTRFIVEVSLSQLGDMQLDGFYKADTDRKLFDLAVRTHQPLDSEVQKNITQIFSEAQMETGAVGTIVFQSGARFPVSPLQEILQNPPDVIA